MVGWVGWVGRVGWVGWLDPDWLPCAAAPHSAEKEGTGEFWGGGTGV